MGLFNLFRKKQPTDHSPEIPKETFIEEVNGQSAGSNGTPAQAGKGIEAINAYLREDFESQGYSDALTNPDESYKKKYLGYLHCQLEIRIREALQYYQVVLNTIDHLIAMNTRQGMVDMVQEMEMKKELGKKHMESVREIADGLENSEGVSQAIFLSYDRGFMRGLAAVTKAKVESFNL